MSIEDILASLNEGDHVGWICYQDGSWALLGPDGWAGPSIAPSDMLDRQSPNAADEGG